MTQHPHTISTRLNMEDKLAWMRRSSNRILEAGHDDDEVQDHFLSFVHASHLLWFYFGKWVRVVRSDTTAKALVSKFVGLLDQPSAEIWRCLDDLRTEDVHTRPVEIADQGPKFLAVAPGVPLLVGPGKVLLAQQFRHVVSWQTSTFGVKELCDKGLSIKELFKDRFDTL